MRMRMQTLLLSLTATLPKMATKGEQVMQVCTEAQLQAQPERLLSIPIKYLGGLAFHQL